MLRYRACNYEVMSVVKWRKCYENINIEDVINVLNLISQSLAIFKKITNIYKTPFYTLSLIYYSIVVAKMYEITIKYSKCKV